MQARVLLRLAKDQDRWGIVLDRFYGEIAAIAALKAALWDIVEKVGLPLWLPAQYAALSSDILTSKEPAFWVEGPDQRFGMYALPVLDQPEAKWSKGADDTYQMTVRVVERRWL
jgi:hypothetical protein